MRMSRSVFSALAAGGVVLARIALALPAASVAADDPQPAQPNSEQAKVEVILELIKLRQADVRSFEYEWKETAERFGPEPPPSPKPRNEEEAQLNADMVRARFAMVQPRQFRLLVDGPRVRFEEQSTHLGFDLVKTVPWKRVGVFDGRVGRSFTPQSESPYPVGSLSTTNRTHGLDYVGSLPLVVALRGADFVTDNMAEIGLGNIALESGQIDNRQCVILRQRAPVAGGGTLLSLWLDPARDYAPVRIVNSMGFKPSSQIDISLERDSKGRWNPIAWRRDRFTRKGTLEMRVEARVVKHTINPRLTDATFSLEFAPGTYVHDTPNQSAYIQKGGVQRPPSRSPRASGQRRVRHGCAGPLRGLAASCGCWRRR